MPNEIRLKSNLRRLKEGKLQMDQGKSKVNVIIKNSGAQFQVTHKFRAKGCTSLLRMCSTMSLLQRRQAVQWLLSQKLVEESYWQKLNIEKLIYIIVYVSRVFVGHWTANCKRLNFLWSSLQRR